MEEAWELAAVSRKAVPRHLKREVFEEAGYRCSVPTCKGTSGLEMAHIVPYSEKREHDFENMILLCAVCHTRYDCGEIERQAILNYKSNLGVTNGRYSLFESRVIEKIFEKGIDQNPNEVLLYVTETDLFHITGLLRDDLVRESSVEDGVNNLIENLFEAKVSVSDDYRESHDLSDSDLLRMVRLAMNTCHHIIMPTDKGVSFAMKYFSGKKVA